VYGIAGYTTGQGLTNDAMEALLSSEVDVVTFQIDAWTSETYRRLQGGGALTRVHEAIQNLCDARSAARQPAPIIVPQFTKCTGNVEELDAFFDGWMRRQGCASIVGYSDHCGQLDDLAVMDMRPPQRFACSRLSSRCVVLADGTVTRCDQDFAARQPIGHLGTATLSEVWTGHVAERLRGEHRDGRFDEESLCTICREWHRP
jgi:hypothetical protein